MVNLPQFRNKESYEELGLKKTKEKYTKGIKKGLTGGCLTVPLYHWLQFLSFGD